MHFIVVKLICKPEKISELKNQLAVLKNATLNKDPGCMGYAFMDMKNNIFVTKALFRTEENFTFHEKQQHAKLFSNMCADLIDSSTKRIFEIKVDWEGGDEILPDEVYQVDSNTSIEDIQAISKPIRVIYLMGEVNHDHILAMPDHIDFLLIEDIPMLLNHENSRPSSVNLISTSSDSALLQYTSFSKPKNLSSSPSRVIDQCLSYSSEENVTSEDLKQNINDEKPCSFCWVS